MKPNKYCRMQFVDNGKKVFPVTIVADSYTGSYSRGLWLAFNLSECEIPDAIGDNDVEELNFWHPDNDEDKLALEFIGKGDTPNDALLDLKRRLNWQRE